MKPENEINEEVRELLDSLEEHGKNARRQKDLSDLIDGLSEEGTGATTSLRGGTTKQSNLTRTKTVQVGLLRSARNDGQRRLYPIWWVIGAAAAVLLLWLLAKPFAKETPNVNEEILVEKTKTIDTIKTEVKEEIEEVILDEPVVEEKLLAEETLLKPHAKVEKPKEIMVEKPEEIVGEEKLLAEATPSESTENADTSTVGSNNIPASIEENLSPLTSHLSPQSSPQRRVIRSLNLVCYECQTENGEWEVENGKWKVENSQLSTFNFPLSTQAQDPNMKNGAMTFELKLN